MKAWDIKKRIKHSTPTKENRIDKEIKENNEAKSTKAPFVYLATLYSKGKGVK